MCIDCTFSSCEQENKNYWHQCETVHTWHMVRVLIVSFLSCLVNLQMNKYITLHCLVALSCANCEFQTLKLPIYMFAYVFHWTWQLKNGAGLTSQSRTYLADYWCSSLVSSLFQQNFQIYTLFKKLPRKFAQSTLYQCHCHDNVKLVTKKLNWKYLSMKICR